jgi:oxygen-independent coproporphyrinogen-3 oxidase
VRLYGIINHDGAKFLEIIILPIVITLKELAVYIHIPFCDHKCIYCDFYSIITTDNINPFLTALKKEIEHYAQQFSPGKKVISIYFGGGTPSLMNPEYIHDIITAVKNNFQITGNVEITLETNPGTVNPEKLHAFKESGINRLSIGIQSFHEDELKFLTRIHDSETAIKTVNDSYLAGFENISIDLIFNLPGQSKEKWKENLQKAVSLPIKHISAYSLILERGTILNKMVLDGRVRMQDEDYDADLYELTIDFLSSTGFKQYEVSNFCREGYECIHNNAYWRYKEYLGFGTSSHSFVEEKRWWNYSSLKRYISEIEQNKLAEAGYEYLSDKKRFSEYVMLALRSSGIEIDDLKKNFGEVWINEKYHYFKMLMNQNLVTFDRGYIRLTKKGYAICDEIIASIL